MIDLNGTIDEVLIRQTNVGRDDLVIILKNLPTKFLYEERPATKLDPVTKGVFVPDPEGKKIIALKEQLEVNKNDSSILFYLARNGVKEILEPIMRYIKLSVPRDIQLPTPVVYTQQPGNFMSGTISRDQIPVIELPLVANLTKPGAETISPAVQTASPAQAIKKERTPDQLEAMRARMAKARAARK